MKTYEITFDNGYKTFTETVRATDHATAKSTAEWMAHTSPGKKVVSVKLKAGEKSIIKTMHRDNLETQVSSDAFSVEGDRVSYTVRHIVLEAIKQNKIQIIIKVNGAWALRTVVDADNTGIDTQSAQALHKVGIENALKVAEHFRGDLSTKDLLDMYEGWEVNPWTSFISEAI